MDEEYVEKQVKSLNELATGFSMPRALTFTNRADSSVYDSEENSDVAANYMPFTDRLNIFIPRLKEKALDEVFPEGWLDLVDEIEVDSEDTPEPLQKFYLADQVFEDPKRPDEIGYLWRAEGVFNLLTNEDYSDLMDQQKSDEVAEEFRRKFNSGLIHELNHVREYNKLVALTDDFYDLFEKNASIFTRAKRVFADTFQKSLELQRRGRDNKFEDDVVSTAYFGMGSDVFERITRQAIREYAKWERKELEAVEEIDQEIEKLLSDMGNVVDMETYGQIYEDVELAKLNPEYSDFIEIDLLFKPDRAKEIFDDVEELLEEREEIAGEYVDKKDKVVELYFNAIKREKQLFDAPALEERREIFENIRKVPSPDTEAFTNFLDIAVLYDLETEKGWEELYQRAEAYDCSEQIKEILNDIREKYRTLDSSYWEKVGEILEWEFEYIELEE